MKLVDFLNPIVPVLPLAHAFGRAGCFFAGCCYGVPTDGILGVVYTHAIGGAPSGVSLLPIQLLEAGINLAICALLMLFTRHTRTKTFVLPVYVVCYGVARFCLEFYRYDYIRGSLFGLSVSQWISAIGVFLSIIYIGLSLRRKARNEMRAL